MIINNVNLPAVPEISEEMSILDIMELVKTFFMDETSEPVVYMQKVFSVTSNTENWKNPVTIMVGDLTINQINWVLAAIIWYQGAGLDQIQIDWNNGIIKSPGYQAW